MEEKQFKFDSIEEALKDFAQGKPILLSQMTKIEKTKVM